jgi:hypothetical protein
MIDGEPNRENIEDERLQELFCPTLESAGGAHEVRRIWSRPAQLVPSCTLTPADLEYVRSKALDALGKIPQDWYTYRVCLWIALAAGCIDDTWFSICREAMEITRGEKISDDHGRALSDTITIFGHIGDVQSLEILERATTREYWGAGFRSRVISRDPARAVASMQTGALYAIALSKPELAIPVLRRIGERFPDKHPHAQRNEEYRFEVGAGFAVELFISECTDRLNASKKP